MRPGQAARPRATFSGRSRRRRHGFSGASLGGDSDEEASADRGALRGDARRRGRLRPGRRPGGGRGRAGARSRCGPAGRAIGRPGGGRPMQDFNELTRTPRSYEGFITLHEKDQHLYAEIKPQQLEQPILAPMVIARGSANAGQPLNFGDEWVLVVPPGRRQPPAHPQEHPLHRPGGHAAGEGGQAELHRLDPDGLADPEHQPPGRRPGDRLRRHLPDRLRPGRLRLPGSEPLALVQDPGLSRQRRDPGRGDVQRLRVRPVFFFGGAVAGGRPAGDHPGPALQPLQGPGPRLPPADGRLPRRPLPQRA